MSRQKSTLTQERLKQLVHYDAGTGIFTWLVQPGITPIIKAGTIAGTTNADGYIYIGIDYIRHLAHRLAWLYVMGQWPSGHIDHKDCNPSNNKFENLRDVSRSINAQNMHNPPKNKTGFVGIKRVGDKWQARIKFARIEKYLGLFETAEEAHQAYMQAKLEYHPGYIP